MSYFDFQEDARMGLLRGGSSSPAPQRRFRFGRRSPQFKRRQSEADAAIRARDARDAALNEKAWEAAR